MPKTTLQLIWCAAMLGFTSVVYFLSLVIVAPFLASVAVIAGFSVVSYRYLIQDSINTDSLPSIPVAATQYLLLIAGLTALLYNIYGWQKPYGDWDAWWLWNYHARFLADARYWRGLLKLDIAFYHPDYPLYTSSGIAFFWRLMGKTSRYVPFLYSLFFTVSTPVLLYVSLCGRNLLVAGALFLLIACNSFYLEHALAQYSDLPLGFLLLCAIICADNIGNNSRNVVATGALLGCCMWTKNEGIMLSAVFLLFHFKKLLFNGHWRLFLAGIALPLVTLIVFKSMTPKTDLIEGQGVRTLQYLLQPERYKLVLKWMYLNFTKNFALARAGLLLYPLISFYKKQWPDRRLMMLLACLACYDIVYVMTTMDLAWHLETSLDRVLFQLMPSFWYVLAMSFTTDKQKTQEQHTAI